MTNQLLEDLSKDELVSLVRKYQQKCLQLIGEKLELRTKFILVKNNEHVQRETVAGNCD